MLSQTLLKIANYLKIAAKPTAFLAPQLQKKLFKDVDFKSLTEQQKSKNVKTLKDQMNKIDVFVVQLAKKLKQKQINRQFVLSVKKKMENGGYSIFQQQNRDNVLNIIDDYNNNMDLLEKQQRDYTNFNTFQDIQKAVDRYKEKIAIAQEKIKNYKVVESSGEYKILELNDYESSKIFTSNTHWCVRHDESTFNRYKPPYYLVLKNYIPFALINMQDTTFLHEQYKVVSDAPISKHEMTSELAKISIDLMIKYHGGKLIYANDYRALFPYYPVEQLVKAYKESKVPVQVFDSVIKSTMDMNDSTRTDKLITDLNDIVPLDKFLQNVSTENQYKQIVMKIYPKPSDDKTNEDEWIKSHVILQKSLYIRLLFQSFEAGKKGKGLFHRLEKFNVSESNSNEYVETDSINTQLGSLIYNGKNLIRSAHTLNQLSELKAIGITAQQSDYIQIFNNIASQKSVDLPIINFFIKQKMLPQDSFSLYTVMKTKKDAIIKKFLQASYFDFNSVMYYDITPLAWAIKEKLPRIVDMFLADNKINKDISIGGKNLFWYAFEVSDYQTATKLLDYVKNINEIFKSGKCADHTLFSYAISIGDNTLIDKLLSLSNLDVNVNSPIDICISNGQKDLINKIMNHKSFDPSYPNENGDAPIMFAIKTDSTFDMFKLIATKTDLSKSSIINKKTNPNMTPLMLAIDYDMPIALIKQYFSKSSFSTQKGNKSILDIILNKLDVKPNDKNMLEIKKWFEQLNPNKSKTKKNDLYKQLLTLAYGRRQSEFKNLLNQYSDEFDCMKQVNGKNIIYILSSLDVTSVFVDILLDFVSIYQKDKLDDLFNTKYGSTTLYQHASKKNKLIMQKYYNCEQQVVKASKDYKYIFAFVKKYLSE